MKDTFFTKPASACLAAIIASSLLAGCASRGSVEEVDTRVLTLDDTVSKLQSQQSQLGSSLRELIEANRTAHQQLQGALKDTELSIRSNKYSINDLSDKQARLTERVVALDEFRTELNNSVDNFEEFQKNAGRFMEIYGNLQEDLNSFQGELASLESTSTTNSRQVERLSNNLEQQKNDLSLSIQSTETRLSNNISDLNRRLDLSASSTSDNMQTLNKRFANLGEGFREIMRLQRQQFESVADEYEDNLNYLDSILPKRSLSEGGDPAIKEMHGYPEGQEPEATGTATGTPTGETTE